MPRTTVTEAVSTTIWKTTATQKKSFWKSTKKDNTEALLLLGMVYLAQDDVENAQAMYKQYISAVGDSAKGYNGLALCDIRSGDYDSALDNITKGLPTATTDEMQSLLFNEIVAYEKKAGFCYCTDQGPGIY